MTPPKVRSPLGDLPHHLDQSRPVELSVVIEVSSTCAVECGGHQPHVVTEHLICGSVGLRYFIYFEII